MIVTHCVMVRLYLLFVLVISYDVPELLSMHITLCVLGWSWMQLDGIGSVLNSCYDTNVETNGYAGGLRPPVSHAVLVRAAIIVLQYVSSCSWPLLIIEQILFRGLVRYVYYYIIAYFYLVDIFLYVSQTCL